MNIEIKELTKEDLKMLKTCTGLLFILDDIEQREKIECIFDSTKNRSEYRYTIEVNSRKYLDYSKYERCVTSAHMYSDCTRTIIESLKVGDVLMFEWYRDKKTHDLLRRHDMCGDTLELIVERKNKRLRYEMSTEVNHKNYRMIKIKS